MHLFLLFAGLVLSELLTSTLSSLKDGSEGTELLNTALSHLIVL